MKALLAALSCFAIAAAGLAINTTLRGNRIGVLDSGLTVPEEAEIASAVQDRLGAELAARGFDAFAARATLDDLRRGAPFAADYYVEIAGSGEQAIPTGSVGVATGPIVADLGVIVSRVAAVVRVYDGRTLELVDSFALEARKTSVIPTGIGIGHRGYGIGFWAGVPLVRYFHVRGATGEVARDAAERIRQRFAPKGSRG